MSTHISHNRGAVTKSSSKLVAILLPDDLHARVEAAIRGKDTDKSKWIRSAIREHLLRQ